MTTLLNVPAIAAGDMVPAGCCPIPAAAAAVQLLMFRDGVIDVEVDESTGILTVSHDDRVDAAELAEELSAVGMLAQVA